jgi:hypothetical protein
VAGKTCRPTVFVDEVDISILTINLLLYRCLDPNVTFSCECPIGYEEDDCSRNIDWCTYDEEVKCHNGGTCVDGIANYTCTCPPGYLGKLKQNVVVESVS